MKRRLTALLLAAVMAFVISGCGGSNNTASSDAPGTNAPGTTAAPGSEAPGASTNAPTEENVTLRFSWWGGDERLAATLEVISQFETLHPNVKIEPEYGGSDGYADKLATQLATGTEPDIIQIDPAYMAQFVQGDNDYFVDLLADGFDFSQFSEDYISLRVNGRFDGRQLGIPTGMSGPALLLNEQLVEQFKDEVGFDFDKPFTWDEMIEWGRKVHEIDSEVYLLCDNKEMIQHILVGCFNAQLKGTGYINEETGEMDLTPEDWTTIYTMVKELYDNNVVPPASYMAAYSGDALQTDPNWIAGKYVGAFCHNSLIANMTSANPNNTFTAGNLPVMDGAIVDGWKANCPQLMCVSKRSSSVATAEAFLDYFFNDENAQRALGVTRSTPATSGGRAVCEEMGILDPIVAKSAAVLAQYTSIEGSKLDGSTEVQQIIRDQIEAVAFGMTSPEQAAADTLDLLQNYVKSLDLK